MSKRSSSDKIEHYQEKIRRLQNKQMRKEQRRRRRVVIFSDSSDTEGKSDNEIQSNDDPPASSEIPPHTVASQPEDGPAGLTLAVELHDPDHEQPPPSSDMVQPAADELETEIDSEFLSALGDTAEEKSKYGEKIHQDLAQRWLPLLRRGMSKEQQDRLLQEYTIPENCKLLRAPSLNPEISVVSTDTTRARDKKLENIQQQLGLGITAISRAMGFLISGDDKQSKIRAIKMLSDACRILSDLHHTETQSRIKLITPNLDKTFLNMTQDMERDEFLFGEKLSEKIKASKTIEKQGLQIKKLVVPVQKSSIPSTSQTSNRPRYQGNWTGPPRYRQPSNRGGRGGAQKNPPSSSGYKKTNMQTRSSTQAQPRAARRQ